MIRGMRSAILLALALLFSAKAHAHSEATPLPKIIQGGVPLVGLSSRDPDGLVVYRLSVPPSSSKLIVSTARGRGTVRLYLRRGAHPTFNGAESDFQSTYPGTNQRIQVANPEPGPWYVGLQGANVGYLGVQLRASTKLEKGAIAPPVFLPPPGIYPAELSLRIKTRGRKLSPVYTLDGSDPTIASAPVEKGKIQITENTVLKSRAYNSNGEEGPISEAEYRVRPAGDIWDLENSEVVRHLAAGKKERHLFRITVEEGRRLVVSTEGGKGKSTVSVNFGSVPPSGRPGRDDSFVRGLRQVEIPVTEAGDYYIALDAGSPIYGRSLVAISTERGPDLMPWAAALDPYVSVENFSEISCEVEEGLIGPGERRLLRYNTEVRNVGTDDLVMPSPEGNPFFEFHSCHGHYHFKGFAASRILDLAGNELRTSRKVSFCLLDNIRWTTDSEKKRRYNCSTQGIQAGWGDVYDSGLPGQWIEIGDLAAGDYQLELTVNPDGILPETNVENNTVRIPVTIPE